MSGIDSYNYQPLLKNVTADETMSKWVDMRGRQNITFYLSSAGTTSSGVVTLEECLNVGDPHDPNVQPQQYSGTPSAITTVAASTFTGDAQVAVHMDSSRAYGWVRARVSTVIGGGGSISVGVVAV